MAIGLLVDCLVCWLIDRLVGSVGWFGLDWSGRSLGWIGLVDWFGWFFAWLIGWLVGWVSWLVG